MVKRDLIRNIIIAVLAIVVISLLRVFVLSTHRVTEGQANDYIHAGDYVTFNKKVEPHNKDFILYTVNGKEYTGRVIADEGKSVTAMDDFLYVNDKPVEETYISKDKSAYLATVSPGNFFTDDFSIGTLTDNKQTKIKKGQYLVLNDNRRDTEDSRKFGIIEKDQIKGVISFRVYPLSRFGFVDVDLYFNTTKKAGNLSKVSSFFSGIGFSECYCGRN